MENLQPTTELIPHQQTIPLRCSSESWSPPSSRLFTLPVRIQFSTMTKSWQRLTLSYLLVSKVWPIRLRVPFRLRKLLSYACKKWIEASRHSLQVQISKQASISWTSRSPPLTSRYHLTGRQDTSLGTPTLRARRYINPTISRSRAVVSTTKCMSLKMVAPLLKTHTPWASLKS